MTADRTPRLAVVVPSYNYERYVGATIASVTSQRHPDCELVVVDDGSTDGSWDVISSLGLAKTLRVPNGGSARAVTAALALTSAPHVLVLDADDELLPGSLGRILAMLDPDVAKLQFALRRMDAEGRHVGGPAPRLRDYRERDRLVAEIRATGCYVTPPTSGNVFRRDVIDLLREVPHDYVDGVTLTAAPFLGDVVSTSEELGRYRIHGRGVSGLGGRPDAARMRRDARLFEVRLRDLGRLLEARGIAPELPEPRDMVFFKERNLYATIVEGSRPGPASVAGLVRSLAAHPMPWGRKAPIALLAAASLVVPRHRARAMLDYRLGTGERSGAGMLRRMTLGGNRAAWPSWTPAPDATDADGRGS